MNDETKYRVLLIEDDEVDKESVYRAIGSEFTISHAANAGIGLEKALADHPDCVLLDYRLPDMDGIALLPDLKEAELAVVMMTGVGNESLAVDALKGGAQDYISKVSLSTESLRKSVLNAIKSSQLQRQLRKQQEELASFVSVASHDLRAPLRHIVRYAELAKDECQGKVSPEVDNYLERVVAGGGRLADLLEALIRFARSGRSDEALVPVCLGKVADLALSNLSVEVEESNAYIHVEALPTVLGHEPSLIELMQNLIGNAIKYAGDKVPRVVVWASPNEGMWTIHVRDNGIGIPQESQEAVFQPFRRLHSYSTIEGSGIGLTSCQRVIEHHGGKIWVDSETNQGSTFSFTLKAAVGVSASQNVVDPTTDPEAANHTTTKPDASALRVNHSAHEPHPPDRGALPKYPGNISEFT